MNPITIIDYSLGLAYVALLFDMALQIRRVYLRKSSGDISIAGSLIRVLASTVFLFKYVYMHDALLTAGQTVLIILLAAYVYLVIWYRIQTITPMPKKV